MSIWGGTDEIMVKSVEWRGTNELVDATKTQKKMKRRSTTVIQHYNTFEFMYYFFIQ